MPSKYEIVEVFWKSAGFTLQVVKIPEDFVNDRLALISTEAGITKIEYDNFLIQKFLIDIERFGKFISSRTEDQEEEIKLFDEVVSYIIQVNPSLNPDKLVVSKSGLLKIPTESDGLCEKLVDSPSWKQFPSDIIEAVIGDENDVDNMDALPSGINATLIPVEWDDVDLVLKIYKFKEQEVNILFEERNRFLSPTNYKVYISRKCVLDFASVMIILDTQGVTADLSPPQIIDKIYDFCININPFLDMHSLQDKNIIEFTKRKPQKSNQKKGTRRNSASDEKNENKTSKEEKERISFQSVTNEKLLSLASRLKKRVIGQNTAIDTVVETIQVAGCGLRDKSKPLGCFMFTGETGTGKTLTAKVLAEELCGSSENLIRIDCSEYSYGHEISRLLGAPPSYIGHDAGGQLTNKISERPFSVVLFDEFEKSHSKLHDVLLQILDEGSLTDGKGETADFSESIVILTSNIGVKDVGRIEKTVGFGDVSIINEDKKTKAIEVAIKKHFKPEFINRLDSIITFNSLNTQDYEKILDLEIRSINKYLSDRNIFINLTTQSRKFIMNLGFDKNYGARNLKRTIEKELVKKLSKEILLGTVKSDSVLKVCFNTKRGIYFSEDTSNKAFIKVL